MKKLFVTLLASIMLLTPSLVSADQEVSKAGQEVIAATANVASVYTVKFPTNNNVSQGAMTFNVDVKGELSSMEKVVLSFPEKFEITEVAYNSNEARKVEVTIASSKTEFVMEDLAKDTYNGTTGRSAVTLTPGTIPPGKWSGTFMMVISLVDRYPEGERAPE